MKSLFASPYLTLASYGLLGFSPLIRASNIFDVRPRQSEGGSDTETAVPASPDPNNPFGGLDVPVCLLTETCPFPNDGECDAGSVVCPQAGSDCFDCDPCQEHNYDCSACISAGCTWCPGDALCLSEPYPQEAFDPFLNFKKTSCATVEDWKSTCDPVNGDNVYTDPLYDSMKWSYDIINVEAVWKMGYTGKGVHVRINDDGVNASHPEFVNKFDVNNSCPEYMPIWNENDQKIDDHGTACASLILAEGGNDECAAGIAPDANASACLLVGEGATQTADEALIYKMEAIDISSNSWGPVPCVDTVRRLQEEEEKCMFNSEHFRSPCEACSGGTDTLECEEGIIRYCQTFYELDPVACSNYLDLFVTCEYAALGADEEEALRSGVTEGRNGLGITFVFAAGNEYTEGTDVNFDGYQNSRFTISVAAVGKDSKHTTYSTPGAAVFISAPGGDTENLSNNIVANVVGGCHDITVGTSFATPVVSGVIALLLEANPGLGYRDVQHIIALTAQMTDEDDDGWVVNSAGIHHSNKYGYGIINAYGAVTTALNWTNLGPELQLMGESIDINLPIINDANETSEAILTISDDDDFVIEHVAVYLDLEHAGRGDLLVTLTSPTGVKSVLAPSMRPENSLLKGTERWKLTTVRNRGENPNGNWSLTVVDENPNKVMDECIDYDYYGIFFDYVDNQAYAVDCETSFNNTSLGVCGDGKILDVFEANSYPDFTRGNITPAEACCGCGGGYQNPDVESLTSWRIMIYGHNGVVSNGTITVEKPFDDDDDDDDSLSIAVEEPESSQNVLCYAVSMGSCLLMTALLSF